MTAPPPEGPRPEGVVYSAQTEMLTRGLFGEPKPTTARRQALWRCRQIRATREWIKPHCWAWFIFTGYLKAAQRQLLALRRPLTCTALPVSPGERP